MKNEAESNKRQWLPNLGPPRQLTDALSRSEKKKQRLHFVTGRLAEPALRSEVQRLANELGFHYTVQVMPITVAALLTTPWVAARLIVPPDTELVVLPGYCLGAVEELYETAGCPVVHGPRDLRDLPQWFGQEGAEPDLTAWNIQIIAEINHAPQLAIDEILYQAKQLKQAGADFIDIGCEPGYCWTQVGEVVQAVKQLGCRVSIDSLNIYEIAAATRAGAELVLSVNSTNRHAAADWDTEVVVIPDQPDDLGSLSESIEWLEKHGVPYRIDPILEPIGFGFAASLGRYLTVRQRWPESEIMMGVGNLTELTDVDSAGVNMLLLGFCQEMGIRSVLTTQVIPWAQSSVRELSIARRLTHYSLENRVPPKRLSTELLTLRDARVRNFDKATVEELGRNVRDWNFRVFVVEGQIACVGGGHYWLATDPFDLFDQIMDVQPPNLDPSHAFYLGYEFCKAMTAAQLGKQYEQDVALDWGFLTVPELDRHRLRKRK